MKNKTMDPVAELDWEKEELRRCIAWNNAEGFGFQCSDGYRHVIYLGEVGHVKQRPYVSLSGGVDRSMMTTYFSGRDSEVFIKQLQEKLHGRLSRQGDVYAMGEIDIKLHDWLGHDYLTIPIRLYRDIPLIIDTVTGLDYRLITCTTPKTMFLPGDNFSLRAFELKIIKQMHEDFDMAVTIPEVARYGTRSVWEHLFSLSNCRSIIRPCNWTTEEGRAFCAELRQILGKNIDPTVNKKGKVKQTRFTDQTYNEVAERYGILHKGSWSSDQNVPTIQVEVKENIKQINVKQIEVEDEDECLVCMEKPATTVVLPCEHKVVCDECSIRLRKTIDNAICMQCRCSITHVSYSDNILEEK